MRTTPTTNHATIQAVVFDMGGVLVELGPFTDILGPASTLESDEFWAKWLASSVVRDFEMGRCTPSEFGDRLVADFGLEGTGEDLVSRFAAWPKGLLPGAGELVESLSGQVAAIGVLSNTNALHWESQPDATEVQALFDRQYLSFELGLAKPDASIFEHVINDLTSAGAVEEPSQILFLDDNQINVDGASAVGMTAAVAKGVDEARTCLANLGLG